MDKKVADAVDTLIARGVFHPDELVRFAQLADMMGGAGAAAQAAPKKTIRLKGPRKRGQGGKSAVITKEALSAYLKDHTGKEAAEHFGVSSATINNKKQAFGLTKKKVSKKKAGKKGKKVGKKKGK